MGKAKDLKKKKLLEQINEFSKVAGYKIKMQKSVAYLYTKNELPEGENNRIKKNKIPRNKFNQGGERPLFMNYKTLMKEIEDNTNK